MKVLITLKNINIPENLGGVGVFYRALRNHLKSYVKYFQFSQDNKASISRKILLRLLDYIRFYRVCVNEKVSPDLIHLNPSLSSSSVLRDGFLLLIASWTGKKTIVYFRGWHSYMVDSIDNRYFVGLLFKWIYKRTDAFIVLSNDFKEKLNEWGFNQKIYTETTVVDNALLEDCQVKEKKNADKNNFSILFLARVESNKGIYEVIKVYEQLKSKYPQVGLTIAGDGSQLNEVKKTAVNKNLLDIKFTGYITGEAKAQIFSESDLYLFPTYHGEGMPNSVLEAMAFGLPVITRPVGGLKDFFEHGKMGFITESKSPEVFTDYVEQLINNPELCHEMSRYNADFARKHFMASVVAKRLERIYDDVLSGSNEEATSWLV